MEILWKVQFPNSFGRFLQYVQVQIPVQITRAAKVNQILSHYLTEMYLESSEAPMMELFAKVVYGFSFWISVFLDCIKIILEF